MENGEWRHLPCFVCTGPKVKNVSFVLHQGEILGFAGLVGAGRTETMRLLYGADPMESGEVLVKGKPILVHHSKDAIANGIGYLSEDRKRYTDCQSILKLLIAALA